MPVSAIVGAAGSVAQGVSSKKGQKKAAKIQAASAAQQLSLLKSLYDQNTANYAPDLASGDNASHRYNQLLGLEATTDGSNPTDILRSTPGYQFRLGESLKAVNSNAYARGMGDSGATLKALQDRGMGIADQTFETYLGDVGNVVNRGLNAKSAIAGLSTNYGSSSNAVTQNNADNQAGAKLAESDAFNKMIDGIVKAGGQAFGSSYGVKKSG